MCKCFNSIYIYIYIFACNTFHEIALPLFFAVKSFSWTISTSLAHLCMCFLIFCMHIWVFQGQMRHSPWGNCSNIDWITLYTVLTVLLCNNAKTITIIINCHVYRSKHWRHCNIFCMRVAGVSQKYESEVNVCLKVYND